jgi:uncharacterized protein YcbX/ferredoxin-NADP reductase/ferredoxin
MSLTVSSLHIYPIKSSAGISLPKAKVDKLGLAFDRRFVISDHQGQFITGRTAPQLCLIHITMHPEGITLNAPNMPLLKLNYADFSSHYQSVSLWGDDIQAQHCTEQANKWFSQYLQRPCALLFFGANSQRNKYTNTPKEKSLAFADGYPLLLISKGALTDLNQRLLNQGVEAVSMAHFRPNIVVDFDELNDANLKTHSFLFNDSNPEQLNYSTFIEDAWQHIRIGNVEFKVSKPCERCIFTTVDPKTALKHTELQPLKTLQQYRKTSSGEVLFGQNLVPLTEGEIFAGDKVVILNKQRPPVFLGFTPPKNNLLDKEEHKPMLTCNKIIDETHDVKTFIFNLASPRHYLAGQHINFSIEINGKEKMCCYTVSSSPTNSAYISLTIKRVLGGIVSNYFHDHFKVGDKIKAKAPRGNFHLPEVIPKKILLLSAGSGITPMLSMLRFMVDEKSRGSEQNQRLIFAHCAKTEQDLISKNEIDTLIKQHGNGEIIYSLSQQDKSTLHNSQMLKVNYGRITQPVLEAINAIEQYEVFVCGPGEFRKSVQGYLKNLGLPRSQYHYESFGERKAPPSKIEVTQYVSPKEKSPSVASVAEKLPSATIAPPETPVVTQSAPIQSAAIQSGAIQSAPTESTSKASTMKITFDKWNKTFDVGAIKNDSPQTILEQGEAAGLILPYSCRAGMCGNCRAQLLKGNVKQLSTDGLSQEEIEQGYILCCSAIAQGDVVIRHE